MGIQNLFAAGGVVMWPLLAFSVLGVALIIERIRFWVRINQRQNRVVREVLNLYRLDNVVGAMDKLQKNADLPLARIFLAALELEEPNPEEFRLALESEAQAEIPVLKRFQNIFETIIGLAPLLGLLGTVLGLIASFASLNLGDVGGTKTTGVTSGISEALVSTASGLIVAIFTLLFANTFRGLYQRQIALIQEYGGQLELLYRRRYERGEKTYASTR
ncbi:MULTISPECIES: MotA/TolQ/ExbB proton channel family protein [unclassified Nostoc]|jgi:biopolymer transport protein ExbB|uniref:MotA/TolQ/ExbB proton channel family protein n=1 Tax=unclassified Nostoc TaxID=2593658 RepID=UPI000DEC747B|nr:MULTISPECIES: MotA/TolQ/ExbB proton channel family protein [unclassified Nostoc]MBD2507084.1 MotA/TolQ/ExbB proton channel family protein [Desmonostoc muscorum FACHB-395]MBD2523057.1 MotA/TolQ/ExbB proton channel family protein [Nostoc sp. FACHB-133]MBE8989188.1 MotA/TolQ/ExbB proton channel family protein [Nostoc sp. LEGE 12450]QHG15693.1 MotA/TolQ/ExbB proton channel family protein [Nostoc sp. ATCC 53789]QLE48242.1 MotA/TolQ/ExbB proton channel family protein [Nostoc sp. C057]